MLFAGDTTLTFSPSNYTDLNNTCYVELENFHKWTLANRLTSNVDITFAYILYHRKNQDFELIIDNRSIDIKSSENFLGVVIDAKLKFDYHIKSTYQNL